MSTSSACVCNSLVRRATACVHSFVLLQTLSGRWVKLTELARSTNTAASSAIPGYASFSLHTAALDILGPKSET